MYYKIQAAANILWICITSWEKKAVMMLNSLFLKKKKDLNVN